ncbi:helix-turn-helix transcriptional regulator [bacterium AH-315-I18]|nr:helix-turn-helix transcriptional regulator [bacterium AH-315-I18]
MHPCALYWLILPNPKKRALPGLTIAQTRQLIGGLEKLQHRTFQSSSQLAQRFKQLHAELHGQPIMGQVAARAAFHGLLVQLLRNHDAALNCSDSSRRTDTIRRIMQWIAKHMTEQTTVEVMAQTAGLGVSRVHERFLTEVGMTPADYRTHLRIRRDQHLLQHTNQTITRISFDLGFSISQYFATVFKKYVGMPPGSYRSDKLTQDD